MLQPEFIRKLIIIVNKTSVRETPDIKERVEPLSSSQSKRAGLTAVLRTMRVAKKERMLPRFSVP